ncbi:hypothetical protein HKX48_004378 [Thoreauomyces humboldtii]|nr:hypothetical protein HKX48_004378 [Thoreauomyces humboldtii]
MFTKYAKNEGKRREILTASSAAGVSVAFGAPLGGVLFALEEVSSYFPMKTLWRSFFCALVAAGTVRLINPLGSGQVVLFQVQWEGADRMGGVWGAWEILPFAIVGVFGGLFGFMFIKLTALWGRVRMRTWIGRHPIMEVMSVALLTGSLGYLWDLTRIGNTELVASLFSQCETRREDASSDFPPFPLCQASTLSLQLVSLAAALVLKVGLAVMTYGTSVPGGIFIPVMGVGALGGRMAGVIVQATVAAFPDYFLWSGTPSTGIVPGVYAVVGAAAALAGCTRMTVSLTVIILELTGSLPSLLPTMLAIMIAKWTADGLAPRGLFESQIVRAGYPFLDVKRSNIAPGTQNHTAYHHHQPGGEAGIMVPAVAVTAAVDPSWTSRLLSSDTPYTVQELRAQLASARAVDGADGGFGIVGTNGILVGYIGIPELAQALDLLPGGSECDEPANDDGGGPMVVFPSPSTVPPRNGQQQQQQHPQQYDVDILSPSHLRSSTGTITSPASGSSDGINSRLQSPGHSLAAWMDTSPLLIPHTAPLDLAIDMVAKMGVRTLCVVCEGRLVGVLHKKTLVAYLRRGDH